VVCADGLTHERAALAAWLAGHDMSPLTGAPLASKQLFLNTLARRSIARRKERNGQAGPSTVHTDSTAP